MRHAPFVLTVVVLVAATVALAGPPCGTLPGSEPAGLEPELFAPGWVNQGARTRDISMTPDGREIYFCIMVGGIRYSTIAMTRRGDGNCWTEPEIPTLFSDSRWLFLEPHVDPSGNHLFFVSDRPETGDEAVSEDIWVADREGDGWGAARRLPGVINTEGSEFFPSVTRDGVLYFTRRSAESRREVIMRARPDGQGGWQEPEELPEAVNAAASQFNAFVDPGERYLVTCLAGHEGNLGQVDYWIAFRDAESDTWRGPVNLGETVNGAGREGWSPYVSPDGRWFFFMSSARGLELDGPLTMARVRELHASPGNGLGHMWWMPAGFLNDLAAEAAD